MRLAWLVIGCSLLTSCHPPRYASTLPRPIAFLHLKDAVREQLLLWNISGMGMPCTQVDNEGGFDVERPIPDDQCFKFTKPQRMRGLWRNDFEGSAFCAAPARQCPKGKWQPNEPGVAWIDFASPVPGSEDTPPGGLYAIDFVGRETAYPRHYGEYGFYNQEVIVDRVISIKTIEPPPPQPTKAETIAQFKKCEAATTCIPNWSYINSMEK